MPKKQTKIITFGEMTPDSGLFAGADTEVLLRAGCAMYSGQPMLIPKIRKILGSTPSGVTGFDINSTSRGFARLFFNNDEPKIWEWVPDPLSSAVTDRTPTVAVFEDLKHTYWKFGPDYLCIPHERGTAAVSLEMDEVLGTKFEAMIPSGTQVLGPHVGQVKSHLIIAGGWDSVNGANPAQWNWSARADHTLWTAASNEAGFAELTGEPQGNEIEGLVTWNDFAIFFTRSALYRIGYQGGAEKWDPQQIGQAHQTLFGLPAIKAGRDCYYIGTDGPRVIVNGEESVPIGRGKVARELMDRTGSNRAIQTLVGGGYDKTCGLCYWVYEASGGFWWVAIYHIESDEFTLLNLGDPHNAANRWGGVGSFDEWAASGAGARAAVGALGTTSFFDQTKPLGSLAILHSSSESADWQVWAQHFDDGSSGIAHNTYEVKIKTKIVRLAQHKSEILEVRPLWRTNVAGEAINPTIDIEYGDVPMLKSTEAGVSSPLTVDVADSDSAARVRNDLPGANGFFHRFTVKFPALTQTGLTTGSVATDYQKLEELSGLEVTFRESGKHSLT